jgi:hypothetical protein
VRLPSKYFCRKGADLKLCFDLIVLNISKLLLLGDVNGLFFNLYPLNLVLLVEGVRGL